MTEYVLLSGIIISLFVGALMVQKKHKSTAEFILLVLLISTAYLIFSYLIVLNGNILKYPSLTVIGFGFPLLPGPLVYLYIKYQTEPLLFQKKDILHFLPFVLVSLLYMRFHFMPSDIKLALLKNNSEYIIENIIRTNSIYVSGIVYITISFYLLYSHKIKLNKQFSNYDKINFNWLLVLNTGLLITWFMVIFIQDDRIIFTYSSIYIICIGYFGLNQSKIFSEKEIIFYQMQNLLDDKKNSNLLIDSNSSKADDLNLEKIYNNVMVLLKEKKLYLNSELKIIDLAILLDIHPNLMSKAINHVSQANFYDLINKMRVDEFLNRIMYEGSDKYTIMSIALDSGFNSKASFNRNFKTIHGITPSEFIKSIRKSGLN